MMPYVISYPVSLCFSGVYGNPLKSLTFVFPPQCSPWFPGVLEVIDFIGNAFPPAPPYPHVLRPLYERGAHAPESLSSQYVKKHNDDPYLHCRHGIAP